MVYCHHCGHQNPRDANFCARCGERLSKLEPEPGRESPVDGDTTTVIGMVGEEPDAPELDPEQQAALQALPQGSALLIVQWGPGAGSRYLIDSDTQTIGRHPRSDVFLDDITVSRHHVTLQRSEGRVVVTDQGSLNGTYVNRKLIEGPTPLNPGDVLQIGKFRMVYHVSPRGLS
ncbi:FHA domain-containing protein [Desertihabitans brevis]|uniref:FHA domain-containing protein n=1 Tax=Desertihabitans brevis TaxID=2268447 RepID=A0A367Z222_9ACTN|nr:FHA domain-containing protein [Desertihabitans brevis]RCK71302.1 FHA domain-containing protein [Desertihabitans brevis]